MRVNVVRPPALNGLPSAANASGVTSSASISDDMTSYLPCPFGMRNRIMQSGTRRSRGVAGLDATCSRACDQLAVDGRRLARDLGPVELQHVLAGLGDQAV